MEVPAVLIAPYPGRVKNWILLLSICSACMPIQSSSPAVRSVFTLLNTASAIEGILVMLDRASTWLASSLRNACWVATRPSSPFGYCTESVSYTHLDVYKRQVSITINATPYTISIAAITGAVCRCASI